MAFDTASLGVVVTKPPELRTDKYNLAVAQKDLDLARVMQEATLVSSQGLLTINAELFKGSMPRLRRPEMFMLHSEFKPRQPTRML